MFSKGIPVRTKMFPHIVQCRRAVLLCCVFSSSHSCTKPVLASHQLIFNLAASHLNRPLDPEWMSWKSWKPCKWRWLDLFVSALPEGNAGRVGPCLILLHPLTQLSLSGKKNPGLIGRPVYLGHKSKCRSFWELKM